MNLYDFDTFIREKPLLNESVSLTIGVFDGFHQGHERIIQSVLRNSIGKPVVFTFQENPKKLLRPLEFHGHLMTNNQKYSFLKSFGIDDVVMIDFSSDFSKLQGSDFFKLIQGSCIVKRISVGHNFHCGKGGKFGTKEIISYFKDCDIEISIVPFYYVDKVPVSSTEIRKLILSGDMKNAKKLLKRAYSIDLANIPSERFGEAIRIEISKVIQILPPPGKYNAALHRGDTTFPVIISIDDLYITILIGIMQAHETLFDSLSIYEKLY